MSNFAVLNDEHKIIRRKEKEAERQAKIQEKLSQAQTPQVGSWADASDEDEEDEKLFRPVSDSESSNSDVESKPNTPTASPKQGAKARPKGESPPDAKLSAKADAAAKPEAKAKASSKKDRKADKAVKEEEDLDAILADMGLPIAEVPESGASSRRKKKKDKEQATAEDGTKADKEEKPEAKSKAKAKAKAEAAKEEPKVEETAEDAEDEVTPEAKEAALEAMRKKLGAKKTSKTSDAAKCAAAEAKKRAANQKTKKDKSGYDR